jgi:hypothetical protein
MRLGEIRLELDGAAHVVDGPGEQRGLGLIAGARHLVLPEVRVADSDMRRGIPGIQPDRALEVTDSGPDLRTVQRLEPHAPFGERLVGLEAARLPQGATGRGSVAAADGGRELRDDPILQVEDVGQQSIRLAVGQRFTAGGIHGARGDPQALARALEAADHREIELQLAAKRRQVRSGPLHRLDDPRAIEDPDLQRRTQVVGHRLGTT